MARKKSGKTAFIQRLFNRTWQAGGAVIPFFIEIKEIKTWFPDLAMDLSRDEILDRLERLHEAELVDCAWSRYAGLEDDTFRLLLQQHLRDEMEDLGMEPDPTLAERTAALIKEKHVLQGKLNHAEGRLVAAMLPIGM